MFCQCTNVCIYMHAEACATSGNGDRMNYIGVMHKTLDNGGPYTVQSGSVL